MDMDQALTATAKAQSEARGRHFATEALIDQVWRYLSRATSRLHVAQTVTRLLAKYDDIGAEPLHPIIKLAQTRTARIVQHGEQSVAELSMDSVTVADDGEMSIFHVLEVELLPTGSGATFTEIVACLQEQWNLPPEPHSKFEQALSLLNGGN